MEQKRNRTKKKLLDLFEARLRLDEKSDATIRKYLHDAGDFMDYAGEDKPITKELVISYKQHLSRHYTLSSANSMLAAVNSFLRAADCSGCVVKTFKVQRETFREKGRELTIDEYFRLLDAARRSGREQMFLLMQTIAATGIRISELPYITVEALRCRRARVMLKGKARVVILPGRLCEELLDYTERQQIESGSVFVTRKGKPLDRSNILHGMKSLCEDAKVEKSKVFPHNFRHLFAVTYYKAERDICHLADLLGHSNINTTRIYTLVSCEEQERQIDELGLLTYYQSASEIP